MPFSGSGSSTILTSRCPICFGRHPWSGTVLSARYRSRERKGRFAPEDVAAVLEDQDLTFLPMTMRHAVCKLAVPLDHEDPFDELLMVQAQEKGLRLLAADRNLAGHPLAIAVHEPG